MEPIVEFCPVDMNVTASQRLTEVNWEEPVFYEVTGDPLKITSNYANPSELPWGTAVIVYTAINTDNGKVAICQFSVDVKREWKPSFRWNYDLKIYAWRKIIPSNLKQMFYCF